MKNEYIINETELLEKQMNFSEIALDSDAGNGIIQIALGLAITRCLYLNDNFRYEEDIEKALDNDLKLVKAFKKLQWQIIYNLIYLGDNDPINTLVDNIICCDLRWGKINGYQKNLYVR